MSEKHCAVDGCTDAIESWVLCTRHYKIRVDMGTLPPEAHSTPRTRFWSKVDRSGECWEWTAFKDRDGYGKFPNGFPGEQYAHRIAYLLRHGSVPTDLQVDHQCHNRGCVNPEHLRLATNAENQQNLRNGRQSKSGVLGVHWRPDAKKWQVTVKHEDQSRHVGYFENLDDAKAASESARAALFTHFQG